MTSQSTEPASVSDSATSPRLPTGSLYHWSLGGVLVVSLPLVVALLSSLVSVSHYTDQGQQALFQTVRATEGGRTLLERLISMERSIRQFQVLKDPELLAVYRQHHDAFTLVARGLRLDGLSEELRIRLESLISAEQALFQRIQGLVADPATELSASELEGYATLTLQARAVIQAGGWQVGMEAEALSEEANQVRREMLLWALLALPLALLLGLLFAYLLIRPIRHLERVIGDLGGGHFERPIEIHGPSDLRDLGRHLDWMRRRLMEVEDEKQRFIRNISHELKTPLATLREGADLLEDEVVGELNQEQREIVQLMKIGALQLNGLVENLLEYQRMVNQGTLTQPSRFNLAPLIKRILHEYRLLIMTKQLEVVTELHSVGIQGDKEAVRMMVGNLFSNAIKFSPDGGRIRLALSQQGGQAVLQVEDQGEGISQADENMIYDEFYQGRRSDLSSVKGSGLGLALVKDTVRRHQGQIALLPATEEYGGARFRLELPAAEHQLAEGGV